MMANAERGEVSLEKDGVAVSFKLTTNAICSIEEQTGKGINEYAEALNDASRFRITDLRLIVAAMTNKAPQEAGDIIDHFGLTAIADKVGEAFAAAFPDSDGEAGSGDGAKKLN